MFEEFGACWRLSEEMIAQASKDDLTEVARILARQSAHYARKYGELQMPNMSALVSASAVTEENIVLLRDGTEALVGVLGIVTAVEVEGDGAMQ